MKTAGATLLAVLIAVRPSVLTAQTIGAIHDAMAREAHRVALSGDQGADDEWAEVRALRPGTKLVITTRGSPPRPILFGRADESHVVVFALSKLGPEETIDRRNLVQINEVITTSSIVGPLVGVAVGLFIGVLSFIGEKLNDQPCANDDCTGRIALAWSLVLGLPTAGGLIGHYASRHTTQRIVYRAP